VLIMGPRREIGGQLTHLRVCIIYDLVDNLVKPCGVRRVDKSISI